MNVMPLKPHAGSTAQPETVRFAASVPVDRVSFRANGLNNVRFGCRLMAFYSEGEDKSGQRRQIRDDLLVKAKDSLLNQSNDNRPPVHGFTSEDDFITNYRKEGNHDGWGLVAYPDAAGKKPEPWQARSTLPAHEPGTEDEPGFIDSVDNALDKDPGILMSHVRAASSRCKQVVPENTHPFVRDNWAFMHNGFANGAMSPNIQQRLKGHYIPLLGFGPSGTTDSEAAFHFFLGKLKEDHGTLDTKTIGLENVRQTFAESIRELLNESHGNTEELDGHLFGLKGRLAVPPIMNFVVSDGENLMAFRKGLKLYLGVHTLPGGAKEYIVSSEAVKPGKSAGKIEWVEIPKEGILTLSRNEDGFVDKSIYSLDELAPQTLAQQFLQFFRGLMASLASYWQALLAQFKKS